MQHIKEKCKSILSSSFAFPILVVVLVVVVLSLQVITSNPTQTGLSKTIQTHPIIEETSQKRVSLDSFDKKIKQVTNKGGKASQKASDELTLSNQYLVRDYSTAPKIIGSDSAFKKVVPITTKLKARLTQSVSNKDYFQPIHATIIEDLSLEKGSQIKLNGANLVGKVLVFKNKDRLYFQFNELILNNKTYSINAVAMQHNKRGLVAEIDNKVSQRIVNKLVETASIIIDTYTDSAENEFANNINSEDVIQIKNLESDRVLSVEAQQFTLFFDRGFEIN